MYASTTHASSRPSVGSTQAAHPSSPSSVSAATTTVNNLSSAAPTSASPAGASSVLRNEDDITHYVLYDGLPQCGLSARYARERQTQAYLHFTHRIRERLEVAHAMVLSANPLSLSVMASQLRMYRWRVTEAQTLLETTSLLQDFVMDTAKHGYRVRRRPAAPLSLSRYAHGRGKQKLQRIAQEEREKLARSAGGLLAAADMRGRADQKDTAAAADNAPETLRRPHHQTPSPSPPHTAAAPSEHAPMPHHIIDGAENSNVEEVQADDTYSDREEDRLPLPPPDALPRLVLVDGFTHEDFADIARHIRFVDKEHGLELLLVLLLPTDPGAAAVASQGAGCVITPRYETTIEAAYQAGYDLVLAHNMDNLLVDFLTTAFVSSVGRWRNDVRSKAAVGNYMSVRNVLLGGLDTAALQQLVWDDNTDDAEVLELLGVQSLSVQGGAKRYGEAGRQLLGQQQAAAVAEAARGTDGRAGYSSGDNDGDNTSAGKAGDGDDTEKSMKRVASSMTSSVPRLRSRPASVAHFGVRLPANQQRAQVPLTSFGKTKDVLGSVMGSRNGGGRRALHFAGDAAGDDGDDDGDDSDSLSGQSEDQKLLQSALEKEMGRLLAENDGKQASIEVLQSEVERLHRTVAILKRQSSNGRESSQVSTELDSLTLRSGNPDRPSSGSMVHLSKQQQIYILKERLEAANDHIVALLKDGRGGEKLANSAVTPERGGYNGRSGRGMTGNASQGGPIALPTAAARRAATGAHAHSLASNVYWRRAYEAYQAARESEMLALFDDDAQYVNATLAELPEVASSRSSEGGRGCSRSRSASAAAQRREREATDAVINALQAELRVLQGRLDDSHDGAAAGAGSGRGDLQARMATHLQAAVERLEAERQRVRHLEELRQTDQLLLNHAARLNAHVTRQLSAARRAEEANSGSSTASDDHDGSGRDGHNSAGHGRKPRRAGKGASRSRARKTAATTNSAERKMEGHGGDDDDNKAVDGVVQRHSGARGKGAAAAATTTTTAAPTTAASTTGKDKGKLRGAASSNLLDPAQVESLIAAAVTDAVAARNRVFRRQLAALAQICRTQLTRVVLKHQKPHTVAYVQMLREELEQAKRDQLGAFRRLQFTLSHLRPDQYDASSIPHTTEGGNVTTATTATSSLRADSKADEASEKSCMIPLCAVTDADVRRAAERVAHEHAAYALRVAYMTAELEREQKTQDAVPPATSATTTSVHKGSRRPKAHEREGTPSAEKVATAVPTAAPAPATAAETTPPPLAVAATGSASSPPPEQLLRAYQTAAQRVKEAIDGVSPIQVYLDAVQAEVEAEQRLSLWCDIDCTQLFRSPPMPSTNMTVPPAQHVALVATNLRNAFPSASEFTLQSTDESMPLYLADVDGSMRDAADVYDTVLRSFATLGEGWSAGYYDDNKLDEGNSGGSGSHPMHCASHGRHEKAAKMGSAGGRGHRKKPLDSEELADFDDGTSRPLSVDAKSVFSLSQAFAQLPLDEGEVMQYQGRLDQLYTSHVPYSAAQCRLYEVLLRAYQQHCIHPLYMATIDTTVLMSNDTSASSMAAVTAAYTQHREVLALLQLLMELPAIPALRALHQHVQHAQRLLDQEEKQITTAAAPRVSSAFLAAVDAALLSCVVDELRWRQLRRSVGAASTTADGSLTEGEAAAHNGDLMDTLVQGMISARTAVPAAATMHTEEPDTEQDVRVARHYMMFCSARVRVGQAGKENSNRKGGGAVGDNLFDISDLPPGGSSSSTAEAYYGFSSPLPNLNSGDGAGRTVARELAELFGKRRATAGKLNDSATAAAEAEAEAAFLASIYMQDGGILSNGDGSGEEGDDENAQAIRRLRMELEYVETLKQQRMEELAMRCGWRLPGRNGGSKGDASSFPGWVGGGGGGGDSSSGSSAYPAIDPERLNFAVKSGTSAWYGMEAAKRVRAILRRRARPDQIIVGGGPDGGGVGVELSRRTALPAVPSSRTKATVEAVAAKSRAGTGTSGEGGHTPAGDGDDHGYEVEDESTDRAPRYERKHAPSSQLPLLAPSQQQQQRSQLGDKAPSSPPGVGSLPPLRPGGTSRAQQQHQQTTRYGGRQQQPSYVSPRDAVNLSAYANLVSGYDGSGGGGGYDVAYAAEDLSSRVAAYRAELTRAAGRLSPATTSTYANGAPYCLPLVSSPAPAGAREEHTAATARPRPPLPQQTSWVYGVPAAAAASLVQQQSTVDPSKPRDTLLFMPPRTRSSMAEAAERGRLPQPRTFGTCHNGIYSNRNNNTPPIPVAGLGPSPFMTPAAMAAQRLQTMLNASMEDPSVAGVPSVAVAVLAHQLADQQQQQQSKGPSSSPATPRSTEGAVPQQRNVSPRESQLWQSSSSSSSKEVPHNVAALSSPVPHNAKNSTHGDYNGADDGNGNAARVPDRPASAVSEAGNPTKLEETVGPEAQYNLYDDGAEEEKAEDEK
jgi:hypothetical protein